MLSYPWKQLGCQTVEIENLNLKHLTIDSALLDFNDFTPLTFEVTVDDGFGGSDSDTVNVTVVAVNNGPSANAGPDTDIDENTPLTLSCTGSDPDGDRLFYSWKQLLV